MPVVVRCDSCLRTELWYPVGDRRPRVEVAAEGGDRRPDGHRGLAAWRVLDRARRGASGPVVGACARCGQPLVAQGDGLTPVRRWEIEVDEGTIVVGDMISGPMGTVSDDELTAWFEERYAERFRWSAQSPLDLLFRGLVLVPVAGIVLGWLLAVGLVVWFLANVFRPPV